MADKLIIFDADGTLRRTTVAGQPCPNAPGEWVLMPGVKERLAAIDPSTKLGIASNQAGVALGFLSHSMAYQLLVDLCRILDLPQRRWRIEYCPHHPRERCACRKPEPGMLDAIMLHYDVDDPAEVLYVGDLESDRECAARAGVPFMWAHTFFDWPPQTSQPPGAVV
jgi:D-glycero-D-manno-heptose 1,7-bisphosphate phosphatase